MQPFDALSIRAVLQEAKPLLINRKVDKVFQLGRDEILVSLRSKGGTVNLFMSAQSVYGRMCLVNIPSGESSGGGDRNVVERYQSKYGTGAPPNFCLMLRKYLTGATVVGVEQLPGERVIDFVFSCTDEVGTASLKVLTAEIMGRHSNLIFWEKDSQKILASSHAVTKDMSRQREVLPNIRYERPPGQDRPSIFTVSESDFRERLKELKELLQNEASNPASSENQSSEPNEGTESGAGAAKPIPATVEQWLISTFTGLGKHLSEELVLSTGLNSMLSDAKTNPDFENILWNKVTEIQNPEHYKPAIKADLSRYSVLGWYPDFANDDIWKKYPTVNDMIENYFRSLEARELFVQLREKIKAEITAESSKLETRKQVASGHLSADSEIDRLKQSGDHILTALHSIQPGQTDLQVSDWTQGNGGQVTIKLNPNLSSVQNAQAYYRQYAKLRSRQGAAQSTVDEVSRRLDFLAKLRSSCEEAKEIGELRRIKETLSGRKPQERTQRTGGGGAQSGGGGGGNQERSKSSNKPKIMSVTSSEGWTIYVGRNRNENDQLINKVANPNDIWLHVLGQGGAHVLIRVPSGKQEPPKNTIMEAAHIAARLSKAAVGMKVRVVYTQCRFVKKVDKNKPGLVRYENEKTIEVDTARPMPNLMKKLFR